MGVKMGDKSRRCKEQEERERRKQADRGEEGVNETTAMYNNGKGRGQDRGSLWFCQWRTTHLHPLKQGQLSSRSGSSHSDGASTPGRRYVYRHHKYRRRQDSRLRPNFAAFKSAETKAVLGTQSESSTKSRTGGGKWNSTTAGERARHAATPP